MKYRESSSFNPFARLTVPTEQGGDIRANMNGLPETDVRKQKLRTYISLLESVQVPGWILRKITGSIQNGVSVYGFFRSNNGKDVKVRLSDHAASSNSSHAGLSLTKPKTTDAITRYLKQVTV